MVGWSRRNRERAREESRQWAAHKRWLATLTEEESAAYKMRSEESAALFAHAVVFWGPPVVIALVGALLISIWSLS